MRYRLSILMVIVLLAVSACNLSSQPPSEEPVDNVPPADTSGKPVVTIVTPQDGGETVVGQQMFVTADATDTVGVTRVQLLANNQIVKTVSSESASGQREMNVLLDYTPRVEGTVTLQVIAFRGALQSDPAQITISVRQETQVTQPVDQPTGVPVIDPNDPTCRALTNTGLNFRAGPGTNYAIITVLPAGTVVPIVGRLGDNSWWQVQQGINIGWVSASFTTQYGICGAVPVVQPPASPTSNVPTSTLTATPTLTRTATPIPSFTPTPGKPDLLVSGINGPTELTLPGVVSPDEPGATGEYTVTITNTGSGSSGQFIVAVTVVSGDQSAEIGVSNLDPGQSISLTAELTFTDAGTYIIQAEADSTHVVDEMSEVNNVGILPNVVVQAAP
ncbi:MAG: SH3 domain-containing protein [Anaerolineaceae bacterium]|nr:SH3 domain-containing protein [Anaerolineaceae bacterium]